MSIKHFGRLVLLGASLAVLLVTVPLIIRGIRQAVNPSSRDVFDATMEYYHDLHARLASGDHHALDELVTRLKYGPLTPIAGAVAEKTIQGLRQSEPTSRLDDNELADWIRSNKDRLEFDPKSKMFRLTSGSTMNPSE